MISAVIAAYNEEACILEFSKRLIKILSMFGEWEVIFMIGGDDHTRRILELYWGLHSKRIKIIYERERGLGTALRKGFMLIDPKSDFVLTMDADLQQIPEEIPNLFELTKYGFDVIIGEHGHLADGRPRFKKIISRLVNIGLRIYFGIPISDFTSDFRIFKAEPIRLIREEIKSKDDQAVPEILIHLKRNGFDRFVETPINFPARRTGESKLSMMRALKGYLKLIWRMR